jgi:hypothetical protein
MSDTSNYPAALDTWIDYEAKKDKVKAEHIRKLQNAVEAIQTELGTDPAGSMTDVKSRLAIMMANNGAIAQGTSFPVSPTPVEGQMFYRTDEDIFYIYNGSDWIPFGVAAVKVFTPTGSPHTWTAPAGVNHIVATVVGAGGGGGGNCTNSSHNPAGGGGAGGSIKNHVYKVTPGNNYTITVGAKGTGGAFGTTTGDPGTNGGASSIAGGDYTLSVAGGTGGSPGTTSGAGAGGAGVNGNIAAAATLKALMDGTSRNPATFAIVHYPGGRGANGSETIANDGGAGGNSMFGEGGLGGSNGNDNATAAEGVGAGGGGAARGAGTGFNGKDGSDGVVIIWYAANE